MKSAAFAVVCLLAACSGGPSVAFYDVTRITTESPTAKAIFAEANQAAAATSKHSEAQKAVDRFNEAQRSPLTDAELHKLRALLQPAVDAANAETQKVHDDASAKLDARLAQIAEHLAAARHLQLVLSFPGKPPFAGPGTDLTSEVIAELDAETRNLANAVASKVGQQ